MSVDTVSISPGDNGAILSANKGRSRNQIHSDANKEVDLHAGPEGNDAPEGDSMFYE